MKRRRNIKYQRTSPKRELFFVVVVLITVLSISVFALKLLETQLLVKDMVRSKIEYEAFREFKISETALIKIEKRVKHMLEKNPSLCNVSLMNEVGYLTFSMMARNYNLIDYGPVDEQTFLRGIGRVAATEAFRKLYLYYKAIITDLECFPVPKLCTADISYSDTWYEFRNYGGKRKHEGSDLMASNNLRGYFPVISITDGIIEKMGWLEQGGYRIGIRSESGAYFYYAHLYSYAPELKQGDGVIAGQLLGFMGDSGYGTEGTIGQFDVHLHLGIYIEATSGEMSINPYWILKILEKYRTEYDYQ